ncbi:MAG: MFS transporter [Candidatus Dadabacteria bacterium]|nr:MFS transporter [Candidatus Dadabacteria bacterium]
MAAFFPVFFKEYWSAGADVTMSTFKLGMANSLASVIVALSSPLIGAIADRGGIKKRLLFFFAMLGIVMTGSLYFIQRGDWVMAVSLYIISTVGFMGGNVFYDSLIVSVAKPKSMNFISSLGFSLGYLGGGLLFAIIVWMIMRPATFGLSSSNDALRISFVMVAVWWAVFSIPIFLFVKEPESDVKTTGWRCVTEGFAQLKSTLSEARRMRVVFLFLIGYWLYIDGVDTMVRMSIDYGMSIGFDSKSLMGALLITQFVGVPATILMGKVGDWIGTKNGIYIGIATYLGITIFAYGMESVKDFYVLAVAVGLVQGGIQSLSRSFYTTIIPKNKSAEFFGLYNMLGKLAAVLGPMMIGWVSVLSGSPRLSILPLMLLFISGGVVLYFVDEKEGKRMARELE